MTALFAGCASTMVNGIGAVAGNVGVQAGNGIASLAGVKVQWRMPMSRRAAVWWFGYFVDNLYYVKSKTGRALLNSRA